MKRIKLQGKGLFDNLLREKAVANLPKAQEPSFSFPRVVVCFRTELKRVSIAPTVARYDGTIGKLGITFICYYTTPLLGQPSHLRRPSWHGGVTMGGFGLSTHEHRTFKGARAELRKRVRHFRVALKKLVGR